MDDAQRPPLGVRPLVGVGDAAQDLVDDVVDERRRQRAVVLFAVARRDLRQRAPVDELLGQVVAVPHLAEVGHGHDVRVGEHRAELGLVDELRDRLRIQCQVRAEPLDHHLPLEPFRAAQEGGEHLGHAALTDALEQPIAPELLAALGRQRRR